MTAHLSTLSGTQGLNAASDYGYAVYLGIIPSGGATLEQATDAGMTVYVCCRYENGKGKAGQWGPVAQAIIP